MKGPNVQVKGIHDEKRRVVTDPVNSCIPRWMAIDDASSGFVFARAELDEKRAIRPEFETSYLSLSDVGLNRQAAINGENK